MSEKSKELVPLKAEETSEQQRALMLLLNQQVCALFDQKDILIRPSPEMNRGDLLKNLEGVRTDPQAHVGYSFGARMDVDESGYFWLNVRMLVWPPNGKSGNNIAFLTPNQTHWICDHLKDNPLLNEALISHTNEIIANLKKGVDRLQQTVEDGKFWTDTSKFNQIFDVVTGNDHRRGWYTSWDIFLENVCPSPPWISPDFQTTRKWDQIKAIGGRVPLA